MAKQIQVQIVGDASSYQRAMKSAGGATSGFGSKLKGMGKAAALSAGAAGVGALVVGIKRGFGEMMEAQRVGAQTNAVLKSTGATSWTSAKQVEELSGALSKKSGVDDEAIQSGANLLLTFKDVRNETGKGNQIFDKATGAILDMSVAMGTDMKSASIQVGKALNDPIKGITALTRVGVSFTEQQKKQIKALVESGDKMGAQKIILAELESQFGGSAEAAGNTLPGQLAKLSNAFDELAAKGIGIAIAKLQELRPAIETFVGVVQDMIPVLKPIAELMFTMFITPMKVIAALIRGDWTAAWDALKAPVMLAVEAVKAIFAPLAPFVESVWSTIRSAVTTAVNAVSMVITTVWGAISGLTSTVWSAVQTAVTTAITAVRTVVTTGVEAVRSAITTAWNAVSAVTSSVWSAVSGAVTSAINAVKNTVSSGVEVAKNSLTSAWNTIRSASSSTWGAVSGAVVGAIDAIKAAVRSVVAFITGIVGAVGSAAQSFANAITAPFSGVLGFLQGIIDKVNAVKSAIAGVFTGGGTGFGNFPDGRAAGGPVKSGVPYVVGERGPELFVPRMSGSIVPNGALGAGSLSAAAASKQGGLTVQLYVAGSVKTETDLVNAIQVGLERKLMRNGSLGRLSFGTT